jgi:HK97 family phage portal protein
MKLLGFNITREKSMSMVPRTQSWFGPVMESFSGAWQRNIVVDSHQNILAFSAVYACVSLISNDIAKLRIKLCEDKKGIWEEIDVPAFSPVLRKPNHFQTRIQFLSQWMTSKLLYGNTYVLKERNERRNVRALYVLDPRGVLPLVAPDGEVFYQLSQDDLAGIDPTNQKLIVPASEIIHDRTATLFHPLVGVSPIYACGASATQGNRIQNFGAKFFENMSRPSGIVTAPNNIDNETAARIKRDTEQAMSGANLGRLIVLGSGLSYEPLTMPAQEAQLIEQQRWTVEDVARAFGVPLYKVQAGNPTFTNSAQFDQDYYKQTLQKPIEDIEVLLDEGLDLPTSYHTELDLEGLLRMDPESRARVHEIEIRSAVATPDEARFTENRQPVAGGDLQQQNYSLAALAKRDAKEDPFATEAKPALPAPKDEPEEDDEEERSLQLAWFVEKELKMALSLR